MASPLQQFEIKTLTPLFEVGGVQIGITNSALAMFAAVGIASLFLALGMRKEAHFLEDVWERGEWAGTVIYGMLEREWHSLG